MITRLLYPAVFVLMAGSILFESTPVLSQPLSYETLKQQQVRLADEWRFHSGSESIEVVADLGVDQWEPASSLLLHNQMPKAGWNGAGWFQRTLDVNSSLVGVPLLFTVETAGRTTIYLDGKQVLPDTAVTSSTDRNTDGNALYGTVLFHRAGTHTLSVYFLNHRIDWFHRAGSIAGFEIEIGLSDVTIGQALRETHDLTSEQMFFVGFTLAFALLHLVLFFVVRSSLTSLYFAVLLLFYALTIYFDYNSYLTDDLSAFVTSLRLHRFSSLFLGCFFPVFFYSLVRRPLGIVFWTLIGLIMITGSWAIWNPVNGYSPLQAVTGLALLECLRILVLEMQKGNRDSRYISAGLLFFMSFVLYDILLDFGVLEPVHQVFNAYQFGTFGLFLVMSIFLARGIAAQNRQVVEQARDLERQELRRQFLEFENNRKTSELEEARRFQLSLIPSEWPIINGLEIASYTQPAAEVGGDYYDYELAPDGTLTVAVGDATGHGMRAGIMVAVAKSLFKAMMSGLTPAAALDRFSAILKKMKLHRMYMAMQLVRIKNGELEVVSAGIPPVLIYRGETGTVETVRLTGMPLGAFTGIPYPTYKTRLHTGDAILMMTDGLPELFDFNREMMEMERIQSVFQESASSGAAAIIENVRQAGENWRQETPQEDDVTLVAIRMKEPIEDRVPNEKGAR